MARFCRSEGGVVVRNGFVVPAAVSGWILFERAGVSKSDNRLVFLLSWLCISETYWSCGIQDLLGDQCAPGHPELRC